MRARALLTAAAGACLLAVPAPAAAAEPGPDRGDEIVFVSNRAEGARELYLVRRDGTGLRRLTFNDVAERVPRFSPDGRRIAFAGLKDGNWDVYVVDRDGSGLVRVTAGPTRDDYPAWTADGRLVYTAFAKAAFGCPCAVRIVDGDGANDRLLPTGPGNAITAEPAPHGDRVAFAGDRTGTWSLYTMHLSGRGLRRVTSPVGAFGDFQPSWSPGGRRLAFLRDLDGVDNDLWVVHANGRHERQLTATPGRLEGFLSWSASGREVLFSAAGPSGAFSLYAVPARGGAEQALSTDPRAPLADSFDDGARDASLWHALADPGSSIVETGGSLVASIEAGAVPGPPWNQVNTHYGSQCSLPGDYDYEVDYRLLQWQPLGFYASLDAFFANAGVSRNASPWGQQYVGWSNGLGAGVPTADTVGSFRLVRSGDTTYAYARGAGEAGWTLVFSGPAVAGDAVFGLGLTAPGDWYRGDAASVAFDDFRLHSGELSCPSWWSDSGLDAEPAARGDGEAEEEED